MIIKSKDLKKNDFEFVEKNFFFDSILVKTGDFGAFLIRPQSKKTSSNDHDYVCMKNKLFLSDILFYCRHYVCIMN